MGIVSRIPIKFINETISDSEASSIYDLGFTVNDIKDSDILVLTSHTSPVHFMITEVENHPSSTSGHYLGANGTIEITGRALIEKFSCIAIGAPTLISVTLLRQ
jgi:hypothetical protein